MNSRRFLVVAVLLFLAGLYWVLWPTSKPTQSVAPPAQESAAQSQTAVSLPARKDAQGRILPINPSAPRETEEPDANDMRRVVDAYLTPISFYGKVLDENNAPVTGASVKLMANDRLLGNGSVYQRTSDAEGCFSLHGARGLALAMDVWKEGYYSTAASRGYFVYGGVRGGDEPANPTLSNPAIFVLRKMGETVPLYVSDRDVAVSKDGQPVEISLRTGRAVPTGQGDIMLQCWTHNEGLDPNKNERFDWRMRLTVPNGGLIERGGEFDFVAPESGYRPYEDINMPKDAESWRSVFQRGYFVKLRNGCFARINFQMTAGGGHFVTIKAHFNPTLGNRNLEFDPAKAVAPPP